MLETMLISNNKVVIKSCYMSSLSIVQESNMIIMETAATWKCLLNNHALSDCWILGLFLGTSNCLWCSRGIRHKQAFQGERTLRTHLRGVFWEL